MKQGLSPQLLDAIGQRLERKEQSLIFLNRRLRAGAALPVLRLPPALHFTVLHRSGNGGNRLHCHHLPGDGAAPAPNAATRTWRRWGAAPSASRSIWPSCFEARILRIDADSTQERQRRSAVRVGAGRSTRWAQSRPRAPGAGVLNADSMLFAHDFRAPERLFAQLMQVAGAGRHQNNGEVLIQTGYRRRQHAQERQRRSAVRVGARGRGRHPGGHADGGQGPRLRALGLVGVLNADSMLFAHDFRAPERLFAQLMQVAGRPAAIRTMARC